MTLLTLSGVEKHFGGLPAVRGVDLEVDEGEILALVGPNGAGKSTLLKALCGIQPPSRGSIRLVDGEHPDRTVELAGKRAHTVRRLGVAMVLQTPRVFETMTVLDNVVPGAMFGSSRGTLSESAALADAERALDFVGLADRAADPVGELNLHQQRFLEMARALAGSPRLLLLDEVMAGLNDTELAASIEIVRRARDELAVTVIWVEHVMTAVMSLAERVVVLDFGAILADGVPDEVMRQPEVVTAYLGESPATVDDEVAP